MLLKTEKAVEKSSVGFYRQSFDGRRRFFACVKPGQEGIHPFQVRSFGSINFPRFTQHPLEEEEEGERILSLSTNENGGYFEATFKEIQKCIERVRTTAARWRNRDSKGRPHRCDVINLAMHSCEVRNDPFGPVGGRAVPTGYACELMEGDEPLARYLVLLPAEDVERLGSRAKPKNLPSMEALDPELFPWPPKLPPIVPPPQPALPAGVTP